jgi:hypothetical protein
MHWIIAKDKKTGEKLTWEKIKEKLALLYPNNEILLRTDEYSTSLRMMYENGTILLVKLNKIVYCGKKDGKWFDNISANSFIFEGAEDKIIRVFKLQTD